MKREVSIDCLKGWAILMLIWSHCIPEINHIKIWIFSWHMQVFFFVCGVLVAKKMNDYDGDNKVRFLKKRCRQLLIPYFVFCTVLIVFYEGLGILSNSPSNIKSYLIRMFSFQGIDSLWFIPCYLLAEAIFKLYYIKLNPKIRAVMFVVVIVGLTFLTKNVPNSLIIKQLLKILVGIMFIYVGFLIQRYEIMKKCSIKISVIILLMGSVLAFVNGFVSIGSLELGNVVLFFIVGTMISMAFANIFQYLVCRGGVFEILNIFGRYSIVILCTNNIVIESIHLLDYKLVDNFLLRSGIFGSLIFALIVSIVEFIIIKLARGKLGILFGYSK